MATPEELNDGMSPEVMNSSVWSDEGNSLASKISEKGLENRDEVLNGWNSGIDTALTQDLDANIGDIQEDIETFRDRDISTDANWDKIPTEKVESGPKSSENSPLSHLSEVSQDTGIDRYVEHGNDLTNTKKLGSEESCIDVTSQRSKSPELENGTNNNVEHDNTSLSEKLSDEKPIQEETKSDSDGFDEFATNEQLSGKDFDNQIDSLIKSLYGDVNTNYEPYVPDDTALIDINIPKNGSTRPYTTRRLYNELLEPTRQFVGLDHPDPLIKPKALSAVTHEVQTILTYWKKRDKKKKTLLLAWKYGGHRWSPRPESPSVEKKEDKIVSPQKIERPMIYPPWHTATDAEEYEHNFESSQKERSTSNALSPADTPLNPAALVSPINDTTSKTGLTQNGTSHRLHEDMQSEPPQVISAKLQQSSISLDSNLSTNNSTDSQNQQWRVQTVGTDTSPKLRSLISSSSLKLSNDSLLPMKAKLGPTSLPMGISKQTEDELVESIVNRLPDLSFFNA